MLDELLVENLGLIATARLEPGRGLVALTGETGAGKTLLLGALRLLRGDQARSDRIGPGSPEARVEGRFLLGEGREVTIGRRLTDGRSRAYLDGVMSPVGSLADRLDGVIEIVGQNEHVALGREATIRDLVDAMLDDAGRAARRDYGEAWAAFRRLLDDRAALGGDRHALERELDLTRHQAREIRASGLSPDEDAELGVRLSRLRHAEEISASVGEAHSLLADEGGASEALGRALDALRRASRHDETLGAAEQRLAGIASEAADLSADLRRVEEDTHRDPAALDEAERRLAVLGDLRRKYGDTLEEVLAFGVAAERRAADIESLLERADGLESAIASARGCLVDAAVRLTAARRAAASRLEEGARAHLLELGFRAPLVRVEFDSGEPGAFGADRLRLLFASDAELAPAPVARIASGGELSRLVLAIRLAGGVADVPVVAFDEIDAGIGGSTALAMGRKLADLASERQVLVVTHLPQVAAFADAHFVVERSGTSATVRRLDGEERLVELARMLGGLPESERGRDHAAELMAVAVDHRAAANG